MTELPSCAKITVDLSRFANSEDRLPAATAIRNRQDIKPCSVESDSRIPWFWSESMASSKFQEGMILGAGGLAKKWLLARRSNSESAVFILKANPTGFSGHFDRRGLYGETSPRSLGRPKMIKTLI